MAGKLTTCPVCEKPVSKNAEACPHCGEPTPIGKQKDSKIGKEKKTQEKKKTGLITNIITCILAILGILTLGIVFVPLAAAGAISGSVIAISSKDMPTIGLNVLAWVLVVVGFFTSPALLIALGLMANPLPLSTLTESEETHRSIQDAVLNVEKEISDSLEKMPQSHKINDNAVQEEPINDNTKQTISYDSTGIIQSSVFCSQFKENMFAAERFYTGKTIILKGKITEIGTYGEDPSVEIEQSGPFCAITCTFPKESKQYVSRLRNGQSVTIKCMLEKARRSYSIFLNKCSLYEETRQDMSSQKELQNSSDHISITDVIDHNKIRVSYNNQALDMQLYGINIGEVKTAETAIKNTARGRAITFASKQDKYGNKAFLVYIDGHSLNEILVIAGYARVDDEHCTDTLCSTWKIAEMKAKQQKKGIWRQ